MALSTSPLRTPVVLSGESLRNAAYAIIASSYLPDARELMKAANSAKTHLLQYVGMINNTDEKYVVSESFQNKLICSLVDLLPQLPTLTEKQLDDKEVIKLLINELIKVESDTLRGVMSNFFKNEFGLSLQYFLEGQHDDAEKIEKAFVRIGKWLTAAGIALNEKLSLQAMIDYVPTRPILPAVEIKKLYQQALDLYETLPQAKVSSARKNIITGIQGSLQQLIPIEADEKFELANKQLKQAENSGQSFAAFIQMREAITMIANKASPSEDDQKKMQALETDFDYALKGYVEAGFNISHQEVNQRLKQAEQLINEKYLKSQSHGDFHPLDPDIKKSLSLTIKKFRNRLISNLFNAFLENGDTVGVQQCGSLRELSFLNSQKTLTPLQAAQKKELTEQAQKFVADSAKKGPG